MIGRTLWQKVGKWAERLLGRDKGNRELEEYYGLATRYHCPEHETLMTGLNQTREIYTIASVAGKRILAEKELRQWNVYVTSRFLSLPAEYRVSDLTLNRLKRLWVRMAAEDGTLSAAQLQEFLFNYRVFYLESPLVDAQSFEEMLGNDKAYLTRIPTPFTYPRLIAFLKVQTLASHERLLGENLLAKQLSAYNYWLCFDT